MNGCCAASSLRSTGYQPGCGTAGEGTRELRGGRRCRSDAALSRNGLPRVARFMMSRRDPPARGTTSSQEALWLRLQRALRTGVHGVEGRRAADVDPVTLLTTEAQVGNSFRYVDLTEKIAVLCVAAHAVFVRITPTHGTPNVAFGITAHAIGDAGLGNIGEHFAV